MFVNSVQMALCGVVKTVTNQHANAMQSPTPTHPPTRASDSAASLSSAMAPPVTLGENRTLRLAESSRPGDRLGTGAGNGGSCGDGRSPAPAPAPGWASSRCMTTTSSLWLRVFSDPGFFFFCFGPRKRPVSAVLVVGSSISDDTRMGALRSVSSRLAIELRRRGDRACRPVTECVCRSDCEGGMQNNTRGVSSGARTLKQCQHQQTW